MPAARRNVAGDRLERELEDLKCGLQQALIVSKNGRISFKDKGLALIEFKDGRVLDSLTIFSYAGGEPDAYPANDEV